MTTPMSRTERQTLARSSASLTPFRIILFTLPWLAAAIVLALFMPATGTVSTLILAPALLILPFKARRGPCPACGTHKTFPFSGFGNACKGCGEEIVLRGEEIHLLEPKARRVRPPLSS